MDVTIHYTAFGGTAATTLHLPECFDPEGGELGFCEALFEATNLQRGALWDRLATQLPTNRTHTSMSVGDSVEFEGGGHYWCETIGWSETPPTECTVCRYNAPQPNRTVCAECEERVLAIRSREN